MVAKKQIIFPENDQMSPPVDSGRRVHQVKSSIRMTGIEESRVNDSRIDSPTFLSAFSTSLGWIGLLGWNNQLISVFAGHTSPTDVRSRARSTDQAVAESDWSPELRNLFIAYSEGEPIDFSGVTIKLPKLTPFRKHVVNATRCLGYGQTESYGELAKRAGHPGAARAVGTVMSTNRFPILIPCHRVLAAGGKLGGYTSPAGTKLKIRLLELEARSIGRPFERIRAK